MKLDLKKHLDFWIGGILVLLLFPFVRTIGLLLRRDHSLQKPKHIAFFKLLGGGSLVVALPTFVALRRKFPQTKISIVTGPATSAFAKSLKIFDEVLIIDDRRLLNLLFSSLRVLFWMFRRVDVSIDLELHSRLSTVFNTIAMVKSRVGLIDQHSIWRKRLYTHSVFLNPFGAVYETYDCIAGLFGIQSVETSLACRHWSEVVVQSKNSMDWRPQSYRSGDYLVLGVGSSELATERRLSIPQWVAILKLVAPHYSTVVLLGNTADASIGRKIVAAYQESDELRIHFHMIAGQTSLEESIQILHSSKCFVGVDSALLHLARWSGIPSLSFWGPSDPRTRLRSLGIVEKSFYQRLSCSPCVHLIEPAPCQGNNICMEFDLKNEQLRLDFQNFLVDTRKKFSTSISQATSRCIVFDPAGKCRILAVQYDAKILEAEVDRTKGASREIRYE